MPFAVYQPYTTDMGYTKVLGYPHLLFPGSARWVLAADLVGIVAMVVRRSRVALFLVVMGGLSAAAVCLDPANKLYNARFLPFWFLCLYLLAGYALAEVVAGLSRWNRRRRLADWVDEVRRRLEHVDGASVATRTADRRTSPTGLLRTARRTRRPARRAVRRLPCRGAADGAPRRRRSAR